MLVLWVSLSHPRIRSAGVPSREMWKGTSDRMCADLTALEDAHSPFISRVNPLEHLETCQSLRVLHAHEVAGPVYSPLLMSVLHPYVPVTPCTDLEVWMCPESTTPASTSGTLRTART